MGCNFALGRGRREVETEGVWLMHMNNVKAASGLAFGGEQRMAYNRILAHVVYDPASRDVTTVLYDKQNAAHVL
jgi:hypothetical protein